MLTARIVGAVWSPLATVVVALSLGLAVWATWRTVRDRPVILRQLWAAAVVEAVLVIQAVLAGLRSLAGAGPQEPWVYWGYVLTSLLILPIAAAWAFAERTRWSSVVLLVAALTVAFLQLRMAQVWVVA